MEALPCCSWSVCGGGEEVGGCELKRCVLMVCETQPQATLVGFESFLYDC